MPRFLSVRENHEELENPTFIATIYLLNVEPVATRTFRATISQLQPSSNVSSVKRKARL
jgi:hypothetical protein